ncbi:MAG: hypothetical protein ACKPKO_50745, partial [Candidatus Fonsibacter sp.]
MQTKQKTEQSRARRCGWLTGPPSPCPRERGSRGLLKKQPQKKHYTPTGNLELFGPLKYSLINHALENSHRCTNDNGKTIREPRQANSAKGSNG